MDGASQFCFSRSTLAAAFTALTGTGLGADQAAFLDQVHEDCGPGEFPDMNAQDLAAALLDFWRFAQDASTSGGFDPRVRLAPTFGADGRDLKRDRLEVVQPDAPFLVDSVMGELGAQGMRVRAMFHPVVELDSRSAGPESLIQVWLEPVGEDRGEALIQGVQETLADVRASVTDFPEMVALVEHATAELQQAAPRKDPEALEEALRFLRWLSADHFVFLGARAYDYPRTAEGGYEAQAVLNTPPETCLGVLRDPERLILRRANEPALLTAQLQREIDLDEPVTVGKSNLNSRVHRRTKMDYISIRRYGPDGRPSGEVRVVGLFTAEAYDRPVLEVPLIRRKAARILERAVRMPGGHNAKRLRNIVENYPRDELFQATEDELLETSLGVLHLYDRPRARLFVRRDPFDRFISALAFFPRDRYDSDLRARAGEILAEAWGGHVSAWYPFHTETGLVRVHFIIGVKPGEHREPDLVALENALAEASRNWRDRFDEVVREQGRVDGVPATDLLGRYGPDAFEVGYQDLYDAAEALADVAVIESLQAEEAVRVRASRRPDDGPTVFRFKLYRPEKQAPLADVLPILESLGLKAQQEEGFPIRRRLADGSESVTWVHEFELNDPRGGELVFEEVKAAFEDTVEAVWRGETENDGFNRLVLELGVPWRLAALVRALARYRGQSGLDPSQAVQEEALSEHPGVVRLILELFRIKFDPALDMSLEDRAATAEITFSSIVEALQTVQSLDHDRVLRRLALLVRALKRTNFYQPDATGSAKPYISFKVASRELEELPAPKPYREIFVWAPHVEGVHLRFGPVARGGLRWSDRRDDFRTEVLGLVKAQQVKNAVIVPVGSKGGFYPKALPRGGPNEEIRAAAIAAYKTFLCGLLDLTDNITASGEVVRPPQVIAHEGDDPYLVVAADKGTATFSDIANRVSGDYGFWLGDAFASGGSAGYDHKVMAITARGAWEAVKRHFREMGKDIQSEPFTVVGVGDMSGDVFGNGMLLSKQIRLLAAFDHRHIFIDPDPDPASSWDERKRMFELPRSSWDDYDRSKISPGGGVYPRGAKTVALSPQARALLEITSATPTPAEVMRAILRAPAELLYLGGIGTYVKAPEETQAEVGDKANDAIRLDGPELRVKVVGEGANLGLTQAGRIAFARSGGRINTDAIDNSAGVDSSDHEVNIKILTGAVEAAGQLDRPARNRLLASMTDEVAAKVLQHNYDQTLALSLMEAAARPDLDAQARFMAELESAGKLDRHVEGLPDAAAMLELQAQNKGLTRPELAVLLAYGKLTLFEDVVGSTAPDDPWFETTMSAYFPEPLARYEEAMKRHRLRREIISTVLANEIVNMGGPTFAPRLRASAGCDTATLVIAFEAARSIFRLGKAWHAVSSLDLQVPAEAQTALYLEISRVLRQQSFWLARGVGRTDATVQGLIDAYRAPADALQALGAEPLSDFETVQVERRVERFVKLGAPGALAREVAVLRPLTATTDIADLAREAGRPVEEVARLYHQTGAAFGFDRLRFAAGGVARSDHFERLAVRRLIEDMLAEQSALAAAVLAEAPPEAGASNEAARAAVEAWIAGREAQTRRALRNVEEVEASGGGWSFAKLTIANAALRELAA
ncbi:MAG: NAD-glutamate dehydrogenase [Proteobacteria bacterium]|nr:NAD-glutamate dehydrogenase [Pseudomonadota bacterium]